MITTPNDRLESLEDTGVLDFPMILGATAIRNKSRKSKDMSACKCDDD